MMVAAAGGVVALVVVVVILFVLGGSDGSATFGQVAAFVLVGFAAFIMLMNVLSYASHVLGMTDGSQPFGLPEGSVRAILTRSLMVLVGVLASFLITGQNHIQYQTSTLQRCVERDVANAFVGDLLKTNASFGTSITVVETCPLAKDQAKKLFDVISRTPVEDRLSEDISKQILTMLSTVLAAMIGFYFGARGDPSAPTSDDTKPSAEAARALDLHRKALSALGALPTTAETADRRGKLASLVAELADLRTRLEHWDAALASASISVDAKAEAQTKKKEAKARLDAIETEIDQIAGPRSSS